MLLSRSLLYAFLFSSPPTQLATADAANSNFRRRWVVQIRPTRQLSRLAPNFVGGKYEVDLYRSGSVVFNGALLDGHWEVKEHPYELLDKLYHKLSGQFDSGNATLNFHCRLWDRCFPTLMPRKITHGIVTLNSSPRLVLATLSGHEFTGWKGCSWWCVHIILCHRMVNVKRKVNKFSPMNSQRNFFQ